MGNKRIILHDYLVKKGFERTMQYHDRTMWVRGTTAVTRYTEQSMICKSKGKTRLVQIIYPDNSSTLFFEPNDTRLMKLLEEL